jgi:hypothetical protein
LTLGRGRNLFWHGAGRYGARDGVVSALPWPAAAPALPRANAPVPVSIAKARTEDVPVYLAGIGAVQCL